MTWFIKVRGDKLINLETVQTIDIVNGNTIFGFENDRYLTVEGISPEVQGMLWESRKEVK